MGALLPVCRRSKYGILGSPLINLHYQVGSKAAARCSAAPRSVSRRYANDPSENRKLTAALHLDEDVPSTTQPGRLDRHALCP